MTDKNRKQKAKNVRPKYEQIIEMGDEKINVLILGTSGCGKSTLINSLLEFNEAPTGCGEACTKEIEIYQNDKLPIRMIDTVGYEYGFFRQNKIKKDILKFCKEGVKNKDVEKLIHMIWFCIDGTVKRISQEILDYLRDVSKDWKNVPIIIVFTKSYAKYEIEENIQMAKEAIVKYNDHHKRNPLNVKTIIPVVAKSYQIDDTFAVYPMGLDVLISVTNELTPEAKKIGKQGIRDIDLKIKSNISDVVIGISVAASVAVGAVPIPIPDATILVPIQKIMLEKICSIYGLEKDNLTNEIVNSVLEIGALTLAGKALVNALKAIPGIGVGASIINASVAGTITLAAGEACKVLSQKVYTGEIDSNNINWKEEVTTIFDKYIPMISEALNNLSKDNNNKLDINKLKEGFTGIIKSIFNNK